MNFSVFLLLLWTQFTGTFQKLCRCHILRYVSHKNNIQKAGSRVITLNTQLLQYKDQHLMLFRENNDCLLLGSVRHINTICGHNADSYCYSRLYKYLWLYITGLLICCITACSNIISCRHVLKFMTMAVLQTNNSSMFSSFMNGLF